MASKMAFLGLGQMGQVRHFSVISAFKYNNLVRIPKKTDKSKLFQAMSSRLCKSQFLESPMLLWNRDSCNYGLVRMVGA